MKKCFIRKCIKRFCRYMENYEITMQELKEKQSNGAIVVDVRSSQEYDEGHVVDAINIPDYEINKNIEEILTDKNQEIVLYCSMGGRGRKAYRKLSYLGYKNVYNLYCGIDNWL